jgi:hypothetical protein
MKPTMVLILWLLAVAAGAEAQATRSISGSSFLIITNPSGLTRS